MRRTQSFAPVLILLCLSGCNAITPFEPQESRAGRIDSDVAAIVQGMAQAHRQERADIVEPELRSTAPSPQ